MARTEWKSILSGQRFGKLRVLSEYGRSKSGAVLWLCQCDCGKQKAILSQSLKIGCTKSCGCAGKDWCRKHGMEGTKIYNVWASMIQRCENQNYHGYASYGGRGISVSDAWRKDFSIFFTDMGEAPAGKSLGRIDNDGPYSKENCQWENPAQQVRNRRNTVFLEYNGVRKTLAEFAESYGIDRKKLRNRLAKGWPLHEALTIKRANAWNGANARHREIGE